MNKDFAPIVEHLGVLKTLAATYVQEINAYAMIISHIHAIEEYLGITETRRNHE